MGRRCLGRMAAQRASILRTSNHVSFGNKTTIPMGRSMNRPCMLQEKACQTWKAQLEMKAAWKYARDREASKLFLSVSSGTCMSTAKSNSRKLVATAAVVETPTKGAKGAQTATDSNQVVICTCCWMEFMQLVAFVFRNLRKHWSLSHAPAHSRSFQPAANNIGSKAFLDRCCPKCHGVEEPSKKSKRKNNNTFQQCSPSLRRFFCNINGDKSATTERLHRSSSKCSGLHAHTSSVVRIFSSKILQSKTPEPAPEELQLLQSCFHPPAQFSCNKRVAHIGISHVEQSCIIIMSRSAWMSVISEYHTASVLARKTSKRTLNFGAPKWQIFRSNS